MSKQLKLLKQLAMEDKINKYPAFPKECIPDPKYTDTTANGLTKCIIHFLSLNNHQAERISSTGRYIDNSKIVTDVLGNQKRIGTGKYIPGTGTKGTADISAVIKGRSVKIEVKIGKDRQSEAQVKYQLSIERAGGEYWIAKDFDGFYERYQEFIKKI